MKQLEKKEVERCEEIELNGVGEERDRMSDEGGDKIDDEEELAAPRNMPTQREREEHEATHVQFRDWCAHRMMGTGRTHHLAAKQNRHLLSSPPLARSSLSSISHHPCSTGAAALGVSTNLLSCFPLWVDQLPSSCHGVSSGFPPTSLSCRTFFTSGFVCVCPHTACSDSRSARAARTAYVKASISAFGRFALLPAAPHLMPSGIELSPMVVILVPWSLST